MSGGLDALFRPRAAAVVGASSDPGKLGSVMAAALGAGELPVVGVNARRPAPEIGLYGSVVDAATALDGPLDLVVSCVPAAATAQVVEDAAAAGAGAVLVCAGGFAEIGPEGGEVQRTLVRVLDRTGIRLLGPNTSGFFAPGRRLTASFVPGARDLPAGGVALVATSGGVNHALAFGLAQRGLGIHLGVGLGAAIDVTQADVLEHLADDDEVTAVALHVEAVQDGRRLVDRVRDLVPRVPVVAVVLGRADVGDFARSHTGALATSWRTTRAALMQAGAVVVDDDRALLDALAVLARRRLPARARPGIGVVTAQAGPGLLLADGARSAGVALPELAPSTLATLGELLPPLTYQRNPVDTGRPGPSFGRVIDAVGADDAVDGVAVYALIEPGALDLAAVLREVPGGLPVVVGTTGPGGSVEELRRSCGDAGPVIAETSAELVAAVRAWDADSRARARLADGTQQGTTVAPLDLPDVPDEHEAKTLLSAFVTVPEGQVCEDREQAHRALARFGRVVVKLLDPEVVHKTDVGGVVVGVTTPEELDTAWDRMVTLHAPRVLVERQAPDGPELLLGLRRDPVFGPVVVLGLGGTAVEALDQVALGLAPLGAADAAALVSALPGRSLLEGWRGGPRRRDGDLESLLVDLSAAFAATEDVEELEINPLRLLPDGSLVALDAVLVTRSTAVQPR
ncbi:acetate--CoA ligase family protein [Nitriliruptor alkaliphilus]|uniref:acetate--CoA ligase family protein n=1 Tax=Nitriliruptor alkaliphilus TaxID=427918 RepID=UPI00069688D3|nr:acetate--CoA ligase family protein [Nitriliruptor alkaliphilus]